MGWNIFWRNIPTSNDKHFHHIFIKHNHKEMVNWNSSCIKLRLLLQKLFQPILERLKGCQRISQTKSRIDWRSLHLSHIKKGSKRNTFEQDGEKGDMGAYCGRNRSVGIGEPKCGLIPESFSVWLESPQKKVSIFSLGGPILLTFSTIYADVGWVHRLWTQWLNS